MTDLERAFLADIAAQPQDNFPRLAYADWLEEHGQRERAEFIRVQCELPKTLRDPAKHIDLDTNTGRWVSRDDDCSRCRHCFLRRRERELLTTPSPGCPRCVRWAPEIILVATGWRAGRTNSSAWEFHRGFISRITLPCDAFLGHAADIIEAVPMLEEVRLSDKKPTFFGQGDRGSWHRIDEDSRYENHYLLPGVLFDRLKDGLLDTDREGRLYEQQSNAQSDLSQACLTLAREQLAARCRLIPAH